MMHAHRPEASDSHLLGTAWVAEGLVGASWSVADAQQTLVGALVEAPTCRGLALKAAPDPSEAGPLHGCFASGSLQPFTINAAQAVLLCRGPLLRRVVEARRL